MTDSSPDAAAEAGVTHTDVAAGQVTGTTTQNSDASSSASSTEQPATMLDAVQAALKPEASPASQEPGEAATAEDPASKTESEDPPEDDDKLSPEELKALSQKTQTRFQKLTSKIKAKDGEIESLKPKAEEFEKISRFVSQAGLTNEDVGFLLQVGALARSQPDKALEHLLPFVQQLQQQAGEVLPADLQERVRLGYITEQDARELSKARSREQLATRRADQSETQRREAEANSERQKIVDSTIAASEKWESTQAAKDPDWHLKRNEVAEKVELAIYKEQTKRKEPAYFPNRDEIVKMSNAALDEINKRFKSRGPKPAEIIPVNPGGAPPRTTPKPTSMLDVVRNASA